MMIGPKSPVHEIKVWTRWINGKRFRFTYQWIWDTMSKSPRKCHSVSVRCGYEPARFFEWSTDERPDP